MKKLSLLILCSLVLPVLILTGCKSAMVKALKKFAVCPGPVEVLQAAQTNYVESVVTNSTVIPAFTNDSGVLVPASVMLTPVKTVTPVILPEVDFTNLALGNGLKSTVSTAAGLAGTAGVPFTETAKAGILGLGGIIVAWLNWKGKRAALAQVNVHADTIDTLQTAGKILVQNLQDLRTVALTVPAYTADIDKKVMVGLQDAQRVAGGDVAGVIKDLVANHTTAINPLAV